MFQQEDIHGKYRERLGQTRHSGEPLDELLPVVSTDGRVIGHTFRSRIHVPSTLILPKVSLWVTRQAGEVLLRRTGGADPESPIWDGAVDGTIRFGESVEMAARRAWLMLTGNLDPEAQLCFTERHLHEKSSRSELTYNFHVALRPAAELSELSSGSCTFWSFEEIACKLHSGRLSDAVVLNLASVKRAFRFEWAL